MWKVSKEGDFFGPYLDTFHTVLFNKLQLFFKKYNLWMSLFYNSSDSWNTAQKMKFFIKDFFSKCDQILNEKLHFLCSVI